MDQDKRYFSLVHGDHKKGRYMGKGPGAAQKAARKAFRMYCSKIHDMREKPTRPGFCEYAFQIVETTRGSSKKVYSYVGYRKPVSPSDMSLPKFKNAIRYDEQEKAIVVPGPGGDERLVHYHFEVRPRDNIPVSSKVKSATLSRW